MNIIPKVEILNIENRKYRVYQLDESKLSQVENMKNLKSQYSYSSGGWKNIEEQTPISSENPEQKAERRQQKMIQEQERKQQELYVEKQKQIKRNQYSHFISIPLSVPLYIDYIQQVKQLLGSKYDDLFIDPRKAHITILMLKLHEFEMIERCQNIIKGLKPKIMGILQDNQNSNKITLKKVNFFGDNVQNARVVYWEIEKNNGFEVIKSIIDLICKTFIDEQIIKESDLSNIKYNELTRMFEQQQIHITLFKSRDNTLFNAEEILEKFKDIEINNMKLQTIELSSLQETDENNYFKSVAKIYLQ